MRQIKSKIGNISEVNDDVIIECRDQLDELYFKLSNPTEFSLSEFQLTVSSMLTNIIQLGKEIKWEIKKRNISV